MGKLYLDLTKIYNHKMVLPEGSTADDENNLGISDHFIKENSFKFNEIVKNGDCECIFRRNEKGQDNVICNSQVLKIKRQKIRKITVFGFSCWGYFKEYLILKCANGTKFNAKAHFADFAYSGLNVAKVSLGKDRENYVDMSKEFCSLDLNTGTGYMYYYETEYDKLIEVDEIIFPDNCFMNIFAITLDTEEINDKGKSPSMVSDLYQEYKRQLFCKNSEK